MANKHRRYFTYPPAAESVAESKLIEPSPQTDSPSFRLAFADSDFLLREDLRPVRLQLELLKPELAMQESGIEATVVMFGSARIDEENRAQEKLQQAQQALAGNPDDPDLQHRCRVAQSMARSARYYHEAQRLAELITREAAAPHMPNIHVITGGGPGIMEAANRGASEAGGPSIGLNIVLPHEQQPNPYITPELCFRFHYFAMRKMHFLMRAKALVVFPGGYGTLDELFEALTLVQTRKMQHLPILIFGKDYWDQVINFEAMCEHGMISRSDLKLFEYVETAAEAWDFIKAHLEA